MLGKQVRDRITGFAGIVIGRCEYLFGCTQFGLAPPATDGKLEQAQWFDEGRLEVIGEGVSPASVTAAVPGGPNRDAPR